MEIKRYFELLWRWAWLIILGAIIAGTAAYLISRNTTPVYQASAKLLIDEAPGSASGNDYSQILLEQRLAQTYVEILTTEPILTETIERLDLPYDSPGELAARTTVSAPPETQIIIVSIEDIDPQRAADTAARKAVEIFRACFPGYNSGTVQGDTNEPISVSVEEYDEGANWLLA